MLMPTSVASAQLPPAPEAVRAQIRASIRRVSAQTGILVDPLIAQGIAQNALIFSRNLCFPPPAGEREICAATIGTPSVIDRIMTTYLIEMATRRPADIETLASRLGKAVDVDIGDAGWPHTEPNEVGVIVLPATARTMPVAMQNASGPIALGSNGKLVLVRPGRHTFVFGSGEAAARSTVSVAALQRVLTQGMSALVGNAVGRVDAPNIDCTQQKAFQYVGPLSMYNWGRGSIVEAAATRRANLSPFAMQPAIDIHITQQTVGTCDSRCASGLSIAFARAIAVWRGGCERCGGNMLAVIRVGQRVWLDVRAADRLRAVAAGRLTAADLDLSKPISSEIQRVFASNTGAASVSYDQIDGDQALTATVCALPGTGAPWVAPLKAALCGGGTPATGFGPLRPTLALRDSDTSCGSAATFIACGVPGGGIQVAMAGSRFVISLSDGTRMAIGPADGESVSLRTVIIHEVGHWFGIPHSETAGTNAVLDLMSETYDPNHLCLTAASKVMLNNAADRRWTYAARDMMGLRRGRTR